MSRFYSPGPNYIYLGVGDSGAYLQLGYTDDTVDVVTGVEHQKISADFAGGLAADYQFMSEEIVISFRLSAYNENILTLARRRLNSSLSSAPGSGLAGALGSLMKAESNTYGLVIQSAYGNASPSAKAPFAAMTPGFIMPRAFLAGDTGQKLGVPIKTPSVTFRAIANFGGNANPEGGSPDGSYVLFHSDFSLVTLPAPA